MTNICPAVFRVFNAAACFQPSIIIRQNIESLGRGWQSGDAPCAGSIETVARFGTRRFPAGEQASTQSWDVTRGRWDANSRDVIGPR